MDDVFLQSYWGSHATCSEGPSTTFSDKERCILPDEERACGKGSTRKAHNISLIFFQVVGEILQRCCYSSCKFSVVLI